MSEQTAIVTIEPSGSRPEDYRRALAAVRVRFGDPNWQRPQGYVWHHPGERGVMQLVPEEMHGEMAHGGGFVGERIASVSRSFTSPLPLRTGHPRLSEAILRDLESALEVALPGAYRRFLLRSNGGKPRAEVFRAEDESEEMVDVFFGLNPGANDDIVGMLQRYSRRVPPGLLPVARDPFGNLILLDVEGGEVLFWDHEREPLEGEEPANVRRIAPDFEAFLRSFLAE